MKKVEWLIYYSLPWVKHQQQVSITRRNELLSSKPSCTQISLCKRNSYWCPWRDCRVVVGGQITQSGCFLSFMFSQISLLYTLLIYFSYQQPSHLHYLLLYSSCQTLGLAPNLLSKLHPLSFLSLLPGLWSSEIEAAIRWGKTTTK